MSRSGSRAPSNSDSLCKKDSIVSSRKAGSRKGPKVRQVDRLVTELDLKYEVLLLQN